MSNRSGIYAVISIISDDGRGKAARFCSYLFEEDHRVNIEQSQGCAMGSKFVSSVLVSGARDAVRRIQRELEHGAALKDFSPRVTEAELAEAREEFVYSVQLEREDEAGLLAELTELMQEFADIRGLAAGAYSAACTGLRLFRVDLKVAMPDLVSVGALISAVTQLRREGWDVVGFDPLEELEGGCNVSRSESPALEVAAAQACERVTEN